MGSACSSPCCSDGTTEMEEKSTRQAAPYMLDETEAVAEKLEPSAVRQAEPLATRELMVPRETEEPCASCAPEAKESEEAPADGSATVGGQREVLLQEARAAISQCLLEEALRAVERLQALDAKSSLPVDLQRLSGWVQRTKTLREACQGREGADWKQFDLGMCKLWRRWDGATLHTTLVWDASGSLQQQIMAMREADVLEPLWEGACWDMWAKHADGHSLVRWLQKDPFTGKKMEVMMERVFCACLDGDMPCWVVLEHSPEVPSFESYEGKYYDFDIAPTPAGYFRSITSNSGRVIQPISEDCCRVTMELSIQVPSAIRWLVSDSLLCFAVRMGGKSTMKSWDQIIEKWSTAGFEARAEREAHFYKPLAQSLQDALKKSAGAQGGISQAS
eukprot:TRINITY_DN82641_c0_g1_i1.p1 TRINITY_DN82641_c0_g1~~TRINITY_DN82641_c0_g1_i1.p1  ORF type:complete len:405 (+),score=90.53 TRINITY_DN82641_c0_g1_i1:45-1217(+)